MRWVGFLLAGLLAALVLVSTSVGSHTTAPQHALVKTSYNKKMKTRIVVDANGRTLYMFTADLDGQSVCTPDKLGLSCVQLWPPLKSLKKPRAGAGINGSKLGVTVRSDKIHQAVYNHHPLYHYSGDKKPGDVVGQGYVGAWYVLSPAGKPIKKKP